MISDALYSNCHLCPRNCGVDRNKRQRGYCGQANFTRAAGAFLHSGEEPPIVGQGGSGTVFFSGCNLKCPFCQNHQLSRGGLGRDVSEDKLSGIFIELQERGAENINLITGTPFLPGICQAVDTAKRRGLTLPIIWNTSSFECRKSLELLEGYIDIYLADLKILDPSLASMLLKTPEYPQVAQRALESMTRQRALGFENTTLISGVVVRHLVLPGFLEPTYQVLEWYKENLHDRALLSVMFQYIPYPGDSSSNGLPLRGVSDEEYRRVIGWLDELHIEEGYVQELSTDGSWRPDFNKPNPFPSDYAQPIWHFSIG